MRWYVFLEGASTYPCAKHGANLSGVGVSDFGPFIRRNLVESGTVFSTNHLFHLLSLKLHVNTIPIISKAKGRQMPPPERNPDIDKPQ